MEVARSRDGRHDRHRFVDELRGAHVEARRHQRILDHEQQPIRRHVLRAQARDDELARLPAVEIAEIDDVRLGRGRLHEVQIVMIVGEELRPAMRRFVMRRVHLRQRRRGAAGGRHPIQRRLSVRREHDHTAAAPRAAASVRRRGEHARRSSGEIDALERAVREEAERLAVRRPERIFGAVRAGHRLRGERIERPHPELRRFVPSHRHVHEAASVRRQRELRRGDRRGRRREAAVGRRRDRKHHRRRLRHHSAESAREREEQGRGANQQRSSDRDDESPAPFDAAQGRPFDSAQSRRT